MIIIATLLDLVGVASVLPFMTLLTNPEIIDTNDFYNSAFQSSSIFGIKSSEEFIFAVGFLVFGFLIFSLVIKSITVYIQLRFALMLGHSIGKRLIEGYLKQPYKWFLNKNSADLKKSILSEVPIVIAQGIKPIMTFMSQIIVILFLIGLLILVDPKITFMVGFTIAGAYGFIYILTHSFLKRIGKKRLQANSERFKIVSEAFGAIKELKILGLENNYISRFSTPSKIFARAEGTSQAIGQLPRFALEAVIFGSLLLLVLYLMKQNVLFLELIPKITFFAFAGYRLMPALQQVYRASVQLRFIEPAVNSLKDDIQNLHSKIEKSDQSKKILHLNKNIKLKGITYHYPNTSKAALNNVSINIPAFTKVGLVGETGSGKTTLVDIILGLLEADDGTLEIDEIIINKKNIRSWQNSIGYVPQQIYLSDDTISGNIAYGINHQNIDQKKVEKASKIANLHDFVIKELPLKYETNVGERGVRLSGGQRQRIGIARALYHNPKILILDEATSALDNITEQVVMDAVNNLEKEMTIIMIAHRLSTVKDCDNIFLLDRGKIKDQGGFEKLIESSDQFRKSARKY
ncbi:ABC transporter ATP-binding protein [Candidatus Pelagibacter bacterium nBUS_49]|uniref:ABC transporter ATP-binding protein n=1 Tax=Candidatus Pelagibacter bacterium nBUS_49 TaxID=3374196 RepID=UPI003EB7E128